MSVTTIYGIENHIIDLGNLLLKRLLKLNPTDKLYVCNKDSQTKASSLIQTKSYQQFQPILSF